MQHATTLTAHTFVLVILDILEMVIIVQVSCFTRAVMFSVCLMHHMQDILSLYKANVDCSGTNGYYRTTIQMLRFHDAVSMKLISIFF